LMAALGEKRAAFLKAPVNGGVIDAH
jgi:hypothetical protein